MKKIYKDKEIYVGTFLGGPLVAGYLIAENFKSFGDSKSAKRTWLYAILATVVIFAGAFMIPDTVKIPNQIIPLLYTFGAYALVQHFQGKKIRQHINAGGQFFSWWRTIGISLIGLAITMAAILGPLYFADSSAEITTKTYGVMKHEITFDKSNITENEIDKIADSFEAITFFDYDVKKYVYVKKNGKNYEISLSCNESVVDNSEALEPFVLLRKEMQGNFPNNKIIFNLVIGNLDNVVKKLE